MGGDEVGCFGIVGEWYRVVAYTACLAFRELVTVEDALNKKKGGVILRETKQEEIRRYIISPSWMASRPPLWPVRTL